MPEKQDAPSFHRNGQPMLEVLTPLLAGTEKQVLEIASGSGQHGPFFTRSLPNLTWWPSDISPDALASINGWRKHLDAKAVQAPQLVDVTSADWISGKAFGHWPEKFDAILSMNMIHISPYASTYGLIEGAANRLSENGVLIFYGPFRQNGEHTAPSNHAFDQSLKSRNREWGIRDLQEVAEIAADNGLKHQQTTQMPANNLLVVFSAME